MSELSSNVHLWEVPSFDTPVIQEEPVDPVEVEARAKARGFEMGKWEGLESGWSEAREVIAQLQSLAEEMSKPFKNLDQVVAGELAQLAMSIARQIVRRELAIDSSTVEQVVLEAIETLSHLEGDIEIYLNPKDVALVEKVATEKLEGRNWKILESNALMPGGCQVKSPTSYVDASIEKQLEMIAESLSENCEHLLET